MTLPPYANARSREYKFSSTVLDAAREYLRLEETKLFNGGGAISARTRLNMNSFRAAKRANRGVVWEVEPGHHGHADEPIFLICQLLRLLDVRVRLKANRAGKNQGLGLWYPTLRFPDGLGDYSLLRIVRNVPTGSSVREALDHNQYFASGLGMRHSTLEIDRPSKFRRGRDEFLQAVDQAALYRLHNYPIGVEEFRWLIESLLRVADAHTLRDTQRKARVANTHEVGR